MKRLSLTITLLVVLSSLQVKANINNKWSFKGVYEDAIEAMKNLSLVVDHAKDEGGPVLQNLQVEVEDEEEEKKQNVTLYIPPQIRSVLEYIDKLELQAHNHNIDVSDCVGTKSDLLSTTEIILTKISKCSKPITRRTHDLIAKSFTEIYNFKSNLTTLEEKFLTCTDNKCFEEITQDAQKCVQDIPQKVYDIVKNVQGVCFEAIGEIASCCSESIDQGMKQAEENANSIVKCISDHLGGISTQRYNSKDRNIITKD